MIEHKEFRSDLYFRLNGLPIHIPPLRDRPEDISPLIDFTVERLRVQLKNPELSVTPAARRALIMHNWPGNVRQLESVIERGFALSAGPVLDIDNVVIESPRSSLESDADDSDGLGLNKIVVRHVKDVLATFGGNQVAAAKALGISRSTLRRKLGEIEE
jgi:DNA-binding NtrC family response regulator